MNSPVVIQNPYDLPRRKRRAEGTKKRMTGLQCNRRRSLRISKRNSDHVVIGETGGGSICTGDNARRGTEPKSDCRTDSKSSHPCRPLAKHNIEISNPMNQLALDSAQSETQLVLHRSPSQVFIFLFLAILIISLGREMCYINHICVKLLFSSFNAYFFLLLLCFLRRGWHVLPSSHIAL